MEVVVSASQIVLQEQGMETIGDLGTMCGDGLRELDLSRNRLTTLAGLEPCLVLEELDVSHNALSSPDCLAPLRPLVLAGRLRRLRTEGNPMTQIPGYRALVSLLLPGLEALDGMPLKDASSATFSLAQLLCSQTHPRDIVGKENPSPNDADTADTSALAKWRAKSYLVLVENEELCAKLDDAQSQLQVAHKENALLAQTLQLVHASSIPDISDDDDDDVDDHLVPHGL